MSTTTIIMIPLIPLIAGIAAGARRKTVLETATLVVAALGLLLYAGGFVTSLIGDRIHPSLEPFAWGKMTTVGAVMMLLGLPVAAIAGVFALIAVAVRLVSGKNRSANQPIQPIARKPGSS